MAYEATHENPPSLVVAGDFQVGKSTTLNAMADGREICLRGNGGIPTSACAMQIGYGLSERFTIQWKTTHMLNQNVLYWTDGVVSLDEAEKMSEAWETGGLTSWRSCAAATATMEETTSY